MLSLAHIVNPVAVPETSDLFVAQPITFETMRVAREFASGQVNVKLLSTQYPEDHAIVPDGFEITPDLDRSVLDFAEFSSPRKLPLLRDILDRLYAASEGADYLIYSNVDIAVMPHFYITIKELIEQKYDALVINRRTIPKQHSRIEEIPLMYAELGATHIGHDCFVFERSAYLNYKLGKICIGINLVGRVLLWNLVYFARNFKEVKDSHLTFHIGNDRIWKGEEHCDYREFNKQQALYTLDALRQQYNSFETTMLSSGFLPDILVSGGDNSPKTIKKVKRRVVQIISTLPLMRKLLLMINKA